MIKRPYQKIERSKLRAWHSELLDWAQPTTFKSQIDQIVSLPELQEPLFKQGGLQFLLDAWIAGRVAIALSAQAVRLCPGERPDFEIKIKDATQQFEVTEADMPERRRGDEDIQPDTIECDPAEDWRNRFDAIPISLKSVIQKKLQKNYAPEIGLVIYVNLGSYGAYKKEALPILYEGTRVAKDAFREILVYWEGTLFRFWRDGRHDFESWDLTNPDEF